MLHLLKEMFGHSFDQNRTCACCGSCCESFGGHLHAYATDLRRWQEEGRDDLLQMVNRLGWIWVDPVTKLPLDRCPFIYRSESGLLLCRINDTKPQMCRDYPPAEHGRRCVRG